MLASLKADFKKIFTVRSTYVLSGIMLLLTAVMCFYLEGYKGSTDSSAAALQTDAFTMVSSTMASIGAVFAAIIVILFMTYEYRYNTIMYTLTANASRTKVLLSKIITTILFATAFSVLVAAASIGLYLLGVLLRNVHLPTQDFHFWAEFGKNAAYYSAYALIALFIAALVRSIVGAVAVLFVFPMAGEGILSMVLKEKAAYLPFTAMNAIIDPGKPGDDTLTFSRAIVVSALYVAVIGIITWLVFLRRDVS